MATTAQNKFDVDQMTTREKLWDSLHHVYGQQIDESNRNYDKAISQADRQMLGRGMQRSSYGSQVLGNLNNQKINAENNIWSNLIADYENRSIAADQQDLENARYEKEYADKRADTIWNQTFQQSAADRAADQWERQFAQGNADTDRQLAASWISAIVAQGGTPSDELLARAGLSRADAEAMRKSASSGSSGTTKTTGNDNGATTSGTENGDTPFDIPTTTASSIFGKVGNFINREAFLAGGNNTTPQSQNTAKTPVVDNNNANANRYYDYSPVTTPTISPIESAFKPNNDEIYYEVDLDEEEKKPGLTKSNNQNNGGKIKSTTVKKSD